VEAEEGRDLKGGEHQQNLRLIEQIDREQAAS
jgi:hypothetical protein